MIPLDLTTAATVSNAGGEKYQGVWIVIAIVIPLVVIGGPVLALFLQHCYYQRSPPRPPRS